MTILHRYNSTVPPVKWPKLFTNVEGTQARTEAWFRIRAVAVHLTVPVFLYQVLMMTNKLWGRLMSLREEERPGGFQNGRGVIRGDEVKRQGQTKLWSGDNVPDL